MRPASLNMAESQTCPSSVANTSFGAARSAAEACSEACTLAASGS
jgi:hypothetical protein